MASNALHLIAGGFMRQYSKEFIYSVCLKPFTTEFKPVAEIFSFTIHENVTLKLNPINLKRLQNIKTKISLIQFAPINLYFFHLIVFQLINTFANSILSYNLKYVILMCRPDLAGRLGLLTVMRKIFKIKYEVLN